MQVTETLSDGLKRAFTIVVPAADIESRRAARLSDLGKTLRLPGFRPGKVPLPVVKQRYGGAVTAEVLEQSVNDATQQVISERGLRAAMQPKVDLVNADPAKDLEFTLEMELMPDIPMPDFGGIELVRRKAEVSDEVLEKAVTDLLQRNQEFVDIPAEELGDRGAATGETAVVDYVGRVDGTEFPGGRGTDVNVEIGGSGFIPGFAEQLEGIRPAETRTITATFPESYGAQELAGKQASFEVTAKALKRGVVPTGDDEFAKRIGFDEMTEVRDLLRRQIQREYDQISRMRLKRDLLDRLNEAVQFTSPQGLVDGEFNQIWARLDADRKEGQLDEEDKAKDEETLRSEYRAIAERRVRLGLLLAEIGRNNGIEVNREELARAMRTEASRYPGQEAQVMEFFRKNPRAADTLRGPIYEEKVVDFVLELAKVSDEVMSPERLAADLDGLADAALATAEPPAVEPVAEGEPQV